MSDFTHFDELGNARMVDVSDKPVTRRTAKAKGTMTVSRELMDAIMSKSVKKGDVLTVAQVAGIMSTRKTADLIPMCHPLGLSYATVTFEVDEEACTITAVCDAHNLRYVQERRQKNGDERYPPGREDRRKERGFRFLDNDRQLRQRN